MSLETGAGGRSTRGSGQDHELEDRVMAVHEPIVRELEDPRDGFEPTPTWWLFALMGLLLWGGWYLGYYSGAFKSSVYDEHPGSASAAVAPAAAADPLTVGRRIYGSCAPCHQGDGKGLPGNFPPLAGSEWVQGDPDTMIRIVLHGLEGGVSVRGTTYNQVMPAWKHLKDEQIAAVASFVRGAFGDGAGVVSPEQVAAVRRATAGRTQPWTQAELRATIASPATGH
jgi:mono/diheme cytochrome c family protein